MLLDFVIFPEMSFRDYGKNAEVLNLLPRLKKIVYPNEKKNLFTLAFPLDKNGKRHFNKEIFLYIEEWISDHILEIILSVLYIIGIIVISIKIPLSYKKIIPFMIIISGIVFCYFIKLIKK